MIDWSEVDWTKSNVSIAAKFGCHRDTVMKKRIELGKPTCAQRLDIDFDSIPYGTKSTYELAKQFKCSPTTIRTQMKLRGISPPPRKKARPIDNKGRMRVVVFTTEKQCSITGCTKKECRDTGLSNPEGLCRDHLMPDDYNELRDTHLSGWSTSMLGRAIGD